MRHMTDHQQQPKPKRGRPFGTTKPADQRKVRRLIVGLESQDLALIERARELFDAATDAAALREAFRWGMQHPPKRK